MKKLLVCGFFILLSPTLAHGITCYNCNANFKDSCQGKAVVCQKPTDRCVTESLYSLDGEYRGVYARCATGNDYNRCGTILMFPTEIQVRNCCYSDKCNGKRAPFPPSECAKPDLGA